MTVQGALQQWLGELIEVEAVSVQCDDATLNVTVQYITRIDRDRQLARYARELA